jgi:uncharacterized protein (TIGR03086 family)
MTLVGSGVDRRIEMDLNTLYERTVETWLARVEAVAPDQWDLPTPCREWSVRDLTNHVVGEDLWAVPLMRGSTIEEVGDRLDGDVLGADPVQTARSAAQEATRTVAMTLPEHGTVHLSYGDDTMDEYIHQLAADHLVHSWDLAAAIGADPRLDPDLVADVATWFERAESLYRSGGVIAARRSLDGDPQHDLLAKFGRDAGWGPAHATIARFSDAFGSGDLDAAMALMTDDCVFESTGPAPDGVRHEGTAAVRKVWEELFAHTREASFTEEEVVVCGDRAVVRWRYSWLNEDDSPGHVRGVDVMRLRDGRITEKLSYVKG